MIRYTKLLFWSDGFTWSPRTIWIRPEHKDDKALHAHEQTHQRQMLRDGTWTMRWRYVTSKKWRLAYELEAYRESVRLDPNPEWYARYLTEDYGFDMTHDEAVAALS